MAMKKMTKMTKSNMHKLSIRINIMSLYQYNVRYMYACYLCWEEITKMAKKFRSPCATEPSGMIPS